MVRMLNFLCLRSDQESGNLMLKAIGFWFCCSHHRRHLVRAPVLALVVLACLKQDELRWGSEIDRRWTLFLRPQKEWPSDRERLEWHKRLISNPFGSKMVPHCITTSAFTADNFGHRVQSIYLRIRQLKSTKHHTKNTKPKIFGFALFTPLFTYFYPKM